MPSEAAREARHMNPKRKRVTLLAGVAALVGTAILCTLAGPRPGPALEIAKVFCTVPAWRGRILFPTEHYVWLSNSQALILPDTNAWPPDPHTYIAVSHRDSRGGLLERSGIDIPANESCATVSADGKSIATVEEVGGEPNTGPRPANSGIDLVIHRFGGGPARRVLLSRGIGAGGGGDWSNPLWSKDGTTLYAMRTSNPRMLRAVRLSDSAPTDLSLPQGLFGAPTVRSGADMAPQLLGVTSRNTLLIGTGYVQNGVATFGSGQTSPSYNFPRASIVELSLGSRPAILRRYAPRAPEGVGIGCFVVSPVGDRIFWGAMCERKPSS